MRNRWIAAGSVVCATVAILWWFDAAGRTADRAGSKRSAVTAPRVPAVDTPPRRGAAAPPAAPRRGAKGPPAPANAEAGNDLTVVVNGTVFDASGSPIGDAEVNGRWEGDETVPGTRTDASGRFSLRATPPSPDNRALLVWANATGFGYALAELRETGLRTFEALIMLERTFSVRGTLVDERGEPLVREVVRLHAFRVIPKSDLVRETWVAGSRFNSTQRDSARVDEWRGVSTLTDASGRFTVTPPVRPDRCILTAEPKDRAPLILEFKPPSPGEDRDLGDIVLPAPERAVTVFLVRADGSPATGVEALFQSMEVPGELQVNSPWAKTDAEGRIQAPWLKPGAAYRIFAKGGGLETVECVISDGARITLNR